MNKLAKGNEGWSTKAKGIDRRKNPFKQLITEATSQENFIAVFQTLEASAMSGDVQSAKALPRVYSRQTNAERRI